MLSAWGCFFLLCNRVLSREIKGIQASYHIRGLCISWWQICTISVFNSQLLMSTEFRLDVKSLQAYLIILLLQMELLQAPSRYELLWWQSARCRHGAWTNTRGWRVHLQVCWAWNPAVVRNTHPRGSLPCLWVASLPQRGASAPRELEQGLDSLGSLVTTRHDLWATLGGISAPQLAPGSCCFRLAEEDLG